MLRSSRKRPRKSSADDKTMLILKVKIGRKNGLREIQKCRYIKWVPASEGDSFSERGNVRCLGLAFALTTIYALRMVERHRQVHYL